MNRSEQPGTHNPTVLVILDGFGLAPADAPGNAITPSTAPHIFSYMDAYPTAKLKAHGDAVGLFKGQEGNSEAGHFAIGAGRPVEQDLVHISRAIEDGTFYKNEAFKQAIQHIKQHDSAAHVMGLLTDGDSAHARPEHLYATLELLRRNKIKKVYLHLFTDGRDSPPHGAVAFLKELRKEMKPHEHIATIMGRFYGMDRNKLWERTEEAYNCMVLGKGRCEAASAEEAIMQAYNRGETDEFICPTVIMKENKAITAVSDHDAIFFFNARSDRARQITKAFVQNSEFKKMNKNTFRRKKRAKDIRFVAMTDFGPDLPGIFTAFPSPDIADCLAKAIGEERTQLFISETEKYAHVTYFLNGGFPEPINGEKRELVRSSGHDSYADRPQMMTKEVVSRMIAYLRKKEYDFICVNLSNADMVGHTGNFKAAKKAVAVLDKEVHRLVQFVQSQGGDVIITADHGNAEQMIYKKTGEIMTEHTTNPVPFILVSDRLKTKRMKKKGGLADVAPTLLKIMGIKKPAVMTGKSLL